MSVWIDVEEAIARTRKGEILIIVDDADRENEGDMFVAAAHASSEALNTFITYARGLVCVPMTGERLDRLDLPAMVRANTSLHGTAFTVPVDARFGTTTGISAHDRARTVKALLDPATGPDDLLRPGHVFPLRAAAGGVLERAGHTEAAVELATLAGLPPAGVICEVVRDDGSMARIYDLERLAQRLGMAIVSVAQIVAYKRGAFDVAERSRAKLPAHGAEFEVHDYEDLRSGEHHLALTLGDAQAPEPLLIRVHSECLTGDVFGSRRCDCGEQLERAFEAIAREGRGAILYLRQEGRGIGLPAKLRAYELQDLGLDTVEANVHQGFPADARDFTVAARMLRHLGVERVRLMTNNPAKSRALEASGVSVARVPIVVHPNVHNGGYLRAKRAKLGHELPIDEGAALDRTEEVEASVARS